MAKLETKDMQEGKSPFDTSTIERELDDLLRQRKLAREGRGLEELIADREQDEGQTEEGTAPQEKAQQGKRAGRSGEDGEKAGAPQHGQERPLEEGGRREHDASLKKDGADKALGAALEQQDEASSSKGVVLHLHEKPASQEREDAPSDALEHDGESRRASALRRAVRQRLPRCAPLCRPGLRSRRLSRTGCRWSRSVRSLLSRCRRKSIRLEKPSSRKRMERRRRERPLR